MEAGGLDEKGEDKQNGQGTDEQREGLHHDYDVDALKTFQDFRTLGELSKKQKKQVNEDRRHITWSQLRTIKREVKEDYEDGDLMQEALDQAAYVLPSYENYYGTTLEERLASGYEQRRQRYLFIAKAKDLSDQDAIEYLQKRGLEDPDIYKFLETQYQARRIRYERKAIDKKLRMKAARNYLIRQGLRLDDVELFIGSMGTNKSNDKKIDANPDATSRLRTKWHNKTARFVKEDSGSSFWRKRLCCTWQSNEWSPGRLIILCALSAAFIAGFDTTVLSAVSATLIRVFGSPNILPFVVSSYTIAQAAAGPLVAAMSNYWGRQKILLGSIGLFMAGLGLSSEGSLIALIAGRTLAGLGAAGMSYIPGFIITDKIKLLQKQVFIWNNAIGLTFNIAASLAGPFGGIVDHELGWKSVFTIQVIMTAVSFLGVFFFGRETRIPPESEKGKEERKKKEEMELKEEDEMFEEDRKEKERLMNDLSDNKDITRPSGATLLGFADVKAKETPTPDPDSVNYTSAWQIDWAGGFLLLLGMAALLVAITIGPQNWTNPAVLTLLSLSLAMFATLAWWEYEVVQAIERRKARKKKAEGQKREPPSIDEIAKLYKGKPRSRIAHDWALVKQRKKERARKAKLEAYEEALAEFEAGRVSDAIDKIEKKWEEKERKKEGKKEADKQTNIPPDTSSRRRIRVGTGSNLEVATHDTESANVQGSEMSKDDPGSETASSEDDMCKIGDEWKVVDPEWKKEWLKEYKKRTAEAATKKDSNAAAKKDSDASAKEGFRDKYIKVMMPIIYYGDFTTHITLARLGATAAYLAQGIHTFYVPIYLEEVKKLNSGVVGTMLLFPALASGIISMTGLIPAVVNYINENYKEVLTGAAMAQVFITSYLIVAVAYDWDWRYLLILYSLSTGLVMLITQCVFNIIIKATSHLTRSMSEDEKQQINAVGQTTTSVITGLGFVLCVPIGTITYSQTHSYTFVFLAAMAAALLGFVCFAILLCLRDPWNEPKAEATDDVRARVSRWIEAAPKAVEVYNFEEDKRKKKDNEVGAWETKLKKAQRKERQFLLYDRAQNMTSKVGSQGYGPNSGSGEHDYVSYDALHMKQTEKWLRMQESAARPEVGEAHQPKSG